MTACEGCLHEEWGVLLPCCYPCWHHGRATFPTSLLLPPPPSASYVALQLEGHVPSDGYASNTTCGERMLEAGSGPGGGVVGADGKRLPRSGVWSEGCQWVGTCWRQALHMHAVAHQATHTCNACSSAVRGACPHLLPCRPSVPAGGQQCRPAG